MMGAAEYGIARRGMDQNLGVAGKTGSCIDKGSWVGLFASVAPIEAPKYAVAVITRRRANAVNMPQRSPERSIRL